MKLTLNTVNKIIVNTISYITITTSIIGCGDDIRILPPNSPSPTNSSDENKDVPKGIFNYGGFTTFAPLRSQKFVEAIKKTYPNLKLRYTEHGYLKPGSGTGIKMLIEGQLDFSQSSRPIKDKEFERAKNTRGFTLKQEAVAIDGIAFFINPKLLNRGVKSITLKQAQKIFIGEIHNWQELGGPNMKIVPFSRNLKAGGTVDFFYETVLEKQPLGKNVREIRNTTKAIRAVAKTLGGISYATSSEVINQQTIYPVSLAKDTDSSPLSPCATYSCQSVNQKNFADGSYPLTRKLFIVIKQDGERSEKAGIAYKNFLLTNKGQKLIEDAGFVPLIK